MKSASQTLLAHLTRAAATRTRESQAPAPRHAKEKGRGGKEAPAESFASVMAGALASPTVPPPARHAAKAHGEQRRTPADERAETVGDAPKPPAPPAPAAPAAPKNDAAAVSFDQALQRTAAPAAPRAVEHVAPPREASQLLASDQLLHASLSAHSAHVAVDAGPLGKVEIHLQVRDGEARVRLDGAAAPVLAAHAAELRTDLAGSGLALASFDVSTGADGRGRRDDEAREDGVAPAGAASRRAAAAPRSGDRLGTDDGSIHVLA